MEIYGIKLDFYIDYNTNQHKKLIMDNKLTVTERTTLYRRIQKRRKKQHHYCNHGIKQRTRELD